MNFEPKKLLKKINFSSVSRRYFIFFLKKKSNINIDIGFKIKKLPIINICEGSILKIGKNVFLNSDNRTYHLNMHSPTKILIDKPNAIIEIGDNCRIHGTSIHAWAKITIGKNCLIAANTHIIDANGHTISYPDVEQRLVKQDTPRAVFIGDNVWIGANSIILPGARIGEGSIISAGSIVAKTVPPFTIFKNGNYKKMENK